MSWRATAALLAASLALTGCGGASYLAQSVGGHLDMLQRARPVADWVADASTPAPLRERLLLARRLREFAVTELQLPDNRSYTRYADLQRNAVVWNVVAAPALSLTLKTWCFPVVGCVGYRGYFDRAVADALAAALKAEGLEVDVYGVPAYSTLGWTDWLGGDPLLNTFVHWPEGELARLIFHELAHQVVYVRDDTTFNESYATAVERLGARRWLAQHAGAAAREAYEDFERQRSDFRRLTAGTRAELKALYDSTLSDDDKRAGKARSMATMHAAYAQLKVEHWRGAARYDRWMARANNATLGVQGAYDDLVPGFERLFERSGGDFGRWHAEVRALAALPRAERRAKLATQP